MEKSYNIFLYYFIVYLVNFRNILYKLDKIIRDGEDCRKTTIYNISKLQLDPTNTNFRNNRSVANYKMKQLLILYLQ